MNTPITPAAAPPQPELKSFSFGGGWQSMAALVMASRGELDYRTFIMANVGDDSEMPGTVTYLHRYAIPYAKAHGLELAVVDRVMKRTKETRTLLQDLTRPGGMSVKIPVRMSNGAPGTRSCTAQFKIKVVGDELKRRGATPERPATVGIGITLDEIGRANASKHEPYERLEYPLLERGIRRADCPRIIRSAGLPVPPKSSCWFCPLRHIDGWHEMRRTDPDLFQRACGLEDELNRRREAHGKKDHVYLTRYGKPLHRAVAEGVDALFDLDDLTDTDDPDDTDHGCDSGWCWT
jgi:hypothetical protein